MEYESPYFNCNIPAFSYLECAKKALDHRIIKKIMIK